MIIQIKKYYLLSILALALLIIIGTYSLLRHDYQEEEAGDSEETQIYGEYLAWEEVKQLFPKYSEANISDFETGLSFRVQRRGGTYHADVQPLTAEDSAIMKRIFKNEWTWKRRAAILNLDNGRNIAASINGMPHGGGSIQGNNFNGHFCIHFRDSKTHCSRKVDLAHKMMIWKAANIFEERMQQIDALETVKIILTAIGQEDMNIVERLLDSSEKQGSLLAGLEGIKNLRIYSLNELETNTFSAGVLVVYKDSDKQCNKKLLLELIKKDFRWKVEPSSLIPLLEKDSCIELDEADMIFEEEDFEMEVHCE